LRAKKGRILAISADASARLAELKRDEKLDFTLLSDPEARVITLYGLEHAEGGLDGETIALPAEILVRADGSIAWRHVAGRITERADPRKILTEIERLP
jgi:peroxiredoxin